MIVLLDYLEMRYIFGCVKSDTVDEICEDRKTESIYALGFTILSLESLSISCKANEVLSAFWMNTNNNWGLKYIYTCCRIN
jgi:hypothetical protein